VKYLTLAFLIIVLNVNTAFAKIERSAKAVRDFKKTHICPSTGKKSTASCPGYVVDHVIPLVCGGPDDPSNMAFQTVKDGKAKDRWELDCSLYAPPYNKRINTAEPNDEEP